MSGTVLSVPSATVLGVDGHPVTVEVHCARGVPSFVIVGLPDTLCREARDRVRAALASSGVDWPAGRITVNLAPSGVPKAGSGLDLPVAVAIAAATGRLDPRRLGDVGFVGELGLDGALRTVPGLLSLAAAVDAPRVVVPAPGWHEARLVGGDRVRPAGHLGEVLAALAGEAPWPGPPPAPEPTPEPAPPDLADVVGQPLGRLAVEVAAAGGHHLLLTGPPGAGKTMLAWRLPGLLPPLTDEGALEVTRIHSAAGLPLPGTGLVRRPPLRAPHHGASFAALVGGGGHQIRPGEISCAHRGVLFLDELAEFGPRILDALRQPLEEGVVRISRARATVELPARFILVGATNPCPCGEALSADRRCRCTPAVRDAYARRISGPLMDRFDLRVVVTRPPLEDLLCGRRGEPTAAVAARVRAARARAAARGVPVNAALGPADLERWAPLDPGAVRVLRARLADGGLSGRGLSRVRAVALTLADLAGDDPPLGTAHVTGALELRSDLDDVHRVA